MMKKKIELKKNKEINKYNQEIQELKEKLNDEDDASKIKSDNDEI